MQKTLFTLVFVLLVNIASAQIKNKGLSFIKNYTAKDYHSLSLTWDILQDNRGIMYFATANGLIEFDGNNWRTITLANKSIIRSLLMDKNGRIYVGAQVELGYLEADSTGSLQYVSLVNKIPEKNRNFDDVWKIHDTEDGIVFQTNKALYIFNDNQFKVLEAKTWFHTSFYVNKIIYVRQQGIGLMELKNGVLTLLPRGEEFANVAEREIYAMLPYGPDKSLIINTLGAYIYDGKSYKSLKIFPEYFPVRCSALLQNGNYAIGTIQNGMFVIDKDGNILQHIDKTKGISNNAVLSMLQDQQGNLWLGLENGISYIETNSPFIFFNEKLNINGSVVYTLVEKDKLYVGTNQGLYVTNWNQKANSLDPHANFTFVKNTYGEVRSLFKIDDKIICGHHDGGFIIKDGIAEKFSSEVGGWIFKKLIHHPPYIIEGTYFGLFLYDYKNGKFIQKHKIKGFSESSRYLEEDEEGNIWISHANKGLWKLRLNDQLDSVSQLDFYDDKKGLPSPIRNRITKIDNELVITTEKGIYKYDKKSDRFYEDKILTGLTGKTFVKGIFPDKKGNIWFIAEELNNKAAKKPLEAGVLKLHPNGSYTLEKIPFSKFNEIDLEHIEPISGKNIVMSTDEGILFSTPEGVINYDPLFSNKSTNSFLTLIRKVEDINQQDSLIFNGAFFDANKIAVNIQSLSYYFPYISNALRFNVSSNQYENIEKMEYQYFMEGFDERWSAWTKKSQKEYTNLPEGNYIFHSRAKNIRGVLGQDATFAFTISPPWYRTFWAYSLYALLALLFIGTTVKLYTIKLRNIIENRTKEIHQKNIDLELQKKEIESKNIKLEQNNKELFELNEEKNYVIGVVSHDLRSPINQIKGITTIFRLTSENLTEEQKESVKKIFNATDRLTGMLSNILNANAIESNQLEMKMERLNLSTIVPSVTETFIQVAAEKKIQLHTNITTENLHAFLDKNYFIQVMENLISNALKFSMPDKNLFVKVAESEGKVKIEVKDEGPGISETDIKKLFKRFQKLSARPTAGEPSTGLGLSIVKKYVEAMNGKVYCESTIDKGATFIVEFEKIN